MKNLAEKLDISTDVKNAICRIIENTEQNPFDSDIQRSFILYSISILFSQKSLKAYTKLLDLYFQLEYVSPEFSIVMKAVNSVTFID